MSLKAFHIVFVTAAIILALGFGIYSLVNYFQARAVSDLLYGAGSLAAAVGLIFYEKYTLKKLKDISYL